MYRLAQEIGVTLDVVKSMSCDEFDGWFHYLSWRADQEKKAMKRAQAKRRR